MQSDHFKGKDALGHVAQTQAQAILTASEIHGKEASGSLSASIDAARETVILLFFVHFLLAPLLPLSEEMAAFFATIFGWACWKTGRSAWLGWLHLEQLHRFLQEERWEIQNHRQQEREELAILYRAKGFEGDLLEKVLDVLMADENQLLKVMVEEELGLSLEAHDHPLKQGLAAGAGVFASGLISLILYWINPAFGLYIAAILILSLCASISDYYTSKKLIPSIIWILGVGGLAIGSVRFLLDYFVELGWLK